jgi:hypothetical protein
MPRIQTALDLLHEQQPVFMPGPPTVPMLPKKGLLSTEHKNPAARRRINVVLANQWLKRNLKLPCRSTQIDGPLAHAKQAVMRTVRLARRWRHAHQKEFAYPVTFRVDPLAPLGYSELRAES